MKAVDEKHIEIDEKFETKIDIDAFNQNLKTKLDTEVFLRVFPLSKSPQETIAALIKKETESFNERVLNMVKLWDQKIATLRSELNIKAIYKKLTKFIEAEDFKKGVEDLRKADQQIQENVAFIL